MGGGGNAVAHGLLTTQACEPMRAGRPSRRADCRWAVDERACPDTIARGPSTRTDKRPGAGAQAHRTRDTKPSGGRSAVPTAAPAPSCGAPARQPGRDAGAKDPKTKERQRCQDQRQGILERGLIAAETLGDFTKQVGGRCRR